MNTQSPIGVAGGGPGGLTLAVALARRGLPVRVYERAPAVRAAGAGLTLQINAVRALATLGLDRAVIEAGEVLEHGRIETAEGELIQHLELGALAREFGQPSVGIRRQALAELLASALPPGTIQLGADVVGVVEHAQHVEVELADGRRERCAALIGADGVHSRVRAHVAGEAAPRYAGYTAWRALVPRSDGEARGTALELWGRGLRFGVVPVGADTTYWFATANTPEGQRDGADPLAELRARFAGFGARVDALLARTPAASLLRNDIAELPPLARWATPRVAVLGDAAHAMTPNLGQGACQAIEDAVVLAAHLAEGPQDVPAALAAYTAARRARAERVVAQARQLGRVGQWQSPPAVWLRRVVFTHLPQAVTTRSLRALYGVALP
jgi:2-polyprenyl-6-methoxyphenol hydroxylase-like FAD-dependent oxidoreductase